MTCVIAVTDGENLVFGADSAGTNLETGEIYTFANEKIFRCDDWLIGHTYSYRLGQILHHRVKWPKPPGDLEELNAFVTIDVVGAIKTAFREAGDEAPDDGKNRPIVLVGFAGRIYAIDNDNSVMYPRLPFMAIGHGRMVASGALYALHQIGQKDDLETWCRKALEAAAQYDPTVRPPFTYLKSAPRSG